MKNIIWEITMEEKNNKEKIAEESVQSNENTVAEEANNKELEINKEETSRAGKCRSRKDCRNCRTERNSRVNKRGCNTGRFRAEANCKKERFKE